MDNTTKALDAFRSMKPEERHYVLLSLIDEGTIKLAEAIVTYSTHLENFKHDAQMDMQKLAESGVLLGEKQIKNIPKLKEGNKRSAAIANARTLLAKGFRGTRYGKELSRVLEGLPIDEKWYKECWALKTADSEPMEKRNEQQS